MTLPTPAPVHGPRDVVVVDVTGEDRLTYLDAVLSQRLRDADPGTATSALELGPHGEPTGVLDLAVLPDRLVLLVPTALAEDVVSRLAGRTFLSDATFTTREGAVVVRVRGGADHALARLDAPAVGAAAEHEGRLWLRWHHGADVVTTEDDATALSATLTDAGIAAGTAEDLDAAEVVAGVPRAPEEITRGRLPEEVGLLPTHVHLDKGCYPGQEAVARMWMLGRPRRRLAILAVPATAGPGHVVDEPGAVELTRTATVDGQHLALGFVRRDTNVGDEPHPGVRVLQLVGDGMAVPGHDPAVRRRRDR